MYKKRRRIIYPLRLKENGDSLEPFGQGIWSNRHTSKVVLILKVMMALLPIEKPKGDLSQRTKNREA